MDWQSLLTLAIVAVAAGFLGHRAWRIWGRSDGGCGGGCGCESKPKREKL